MMLPVSKENQKFIILLNHFSGPLPAGEISPLFQKEPKEMTKSKFYPILEH